MVTINMTGGQLMNFLSHLVPADISGMINSKNIAFKDKITAKMYDIFNRTMYRDVLGSTLDIFSVPEMEDMIRMIEAGVSVPPAAEYNKKYLSWKIKHGKPAHVLSGGLREDCFVREEGGKVLIGIDQSYRRTEKIIERKKEILGMEEELGLDASLNIHKEFIKERIVVKNREFAVMRYTQTSKDLKRQMKERALKVPFKRGKGKNAPDNPFLWSSFNIAKAQENNKSIVKSTVVIGWQDVMSMLYNSVLELARSV